jgi:hypothetical protein
VIVPNRRTSLVAGGFIAGALIGALPPVQALGAAWQCAFKGGRYDAAVRACELRLHPAAPGLDSRDLPVPRERLDTEAQ